VYFLAIESDWIDNMSSRFGTNSYDMNTLTTGRWKIWGVYLSYLYTTGSWVWGNGLNYLLPLGRAAHNTVIQCVYCLGIVGTFILYRFIKLIYKKIPSKYELTGTNKDGVMFLIFIFLTMFFLDGLFIEIYYYAFALVFVYIKTMKSKNELLSA